MALAIPGGSTIAPEGSRRPSAAASSPRRDFRWKQRLAPSLLSLAVVIPGAGAQSADELVRQGSALQRQGDARGAIAAFREAAAKAPGRLDVILQLSIAQMRASQPAQAAETLERGKLLAPRHPGVAYFLGLAYLESDRPEEARDELALILEQQPSNIQALHLWGVCMLRLGQMEDGIRALERVAEENPRNRQALYTLGSAYLKAGRIDHAKTLVSKELDGDQSPEALLVKGSLQLSEKRYGDALPLLERARDANPRLATVHSQIGVAYLYEGRRDRAERQFREELAINPRDFNANAFLGWLVQQSGDSEQALSLLRAAEAQQQSDLGVMYLLAQAHSSQGNWGGAAELLEAVTQAQPEFTPAHVMLARAYAKLKRTDLFRRQQQRIKELNAEQQRRDLRGVDRLYDGAVLNLPRD